MRVWRMVVFLATVALATAGTGCRGRPSPRPPIHINPNMDLQPKLKPQRASAFFSDGAGMRPPVPGTVARGKLHDDQVFYTGKDPDGKPVPASPVAVTLESLERGRERFNIYCAVCHGGVGDGQSLMVKRGLVPPPTFHSDLMRGYPDGHFFNVITHGIRNMPAYGPQIPPEDRWHIVNYLRALQLSQNATPDDVPEDLRTTMGLGATSRRVKR